MPGGSTSKTALEAMFASGTAQDVDRYEPQEPVYYPPNPNAGEGSWLTWFGGSHGDAGDQALGYVGMGSDAAVFVGSIVAEPIDWLPLTGSTSSSEPLTTTPASTKVRVGRKATAGLSAGSPVRALTQVRPWSSE